MRAPHGHTAANLEWRERLDGAWAVAQAVLEGKTAEPTRELATAVIEMRDDIAVLADRAMSLEWAVRKLRGMIPLGERKAPTQMEWLEVARTVDRILAENGDQ